MLVLSAFIFDSPYAGAQVKKFITGKLTDGKNNQAVSFATIALTRVSDSTISGGAFSDENGLFKIGPVTTGKYVLAVSSIGYKPLTSPVEVFNEAVTDAGTFILRDTAIMLKELIISAERVKGKAESDRTTYNVTEKIVNASGTGTDVLKLIPGVQIDLMQNISLEGSTAIMIYVDSKERDKGFVSQLDPKQIDRIEIISIPPSNFDGNLTGAINIVLKKNSDSGFNGKILAEIPTSRSVVYIFPAYSLSYGFKKLNVYTSYNGEMTYLDQQEKFSREFWIDSDTSSTTTAHEVRQKNWSHRFHYGLDYFLDARNQFNLYIYYNTYSRELDGNAYSQMSGITSNTWMAGKDDNDKNFSSFYSLFYKHTFSKRGGIITSDISRYALKGENTTTFVSLSSGDNMSILKNTSKPAQEMLSIKIDYSTPVTNGFNFSSGFKSKFQLSKDRLGDFEYRENIFALFGNVMYKLEKIEMNGGLRVEKSTANLRYSYNKAHIDLFPYASFRYKLTPTQNLQLSYNSSIRRPNLNQLNPSMVINDPWSVSAGNSFLRPEFLRSVYLEHSVQLRGNYLASRFFFNRADNVINNLMYINSDGNFENRFHNLGYMTQYGLQLSGSLKISFLTLNPFIKAYSLKTYGNDIAKINSAENKMRPGFEPGLSAIASFKHDLSFSLNIQYKTPQYDIQSRSFSDAVYFLNIEKIIREKFRIGVASAIPFTRAFTYSGSEVNGPGFHSLYQGKVIMRRMPFWFKVGYQFNSGKNRDKINREKEDVENLRKKAF
jgi:outer membrane receptor protein involved in Fe transport